MTQLYVKTTSGQYRVADEQTLKQALNTTPTQVTLLSSASLMAAYAHRRLAHLEHELFCVAHLDSCNALIEFEELFRGTVNGASVYPREIVKSALAHNATAVVLIHNHPSGSLKPSTCDRQITQRLKSALALVDIRVLDHLIVSRNGYTSMAEEGVV